MKNSRKLVVVFILVLALGMLTISLAVAGNGDSLAASPNPAVAQSGQMPAVATGGTITITHSATQNITPGASVHCGATGTPYHTPNSYYRVFDLANDFGIVGDFSVTAVQYGIEAATGNTGSQPVDVNLYTLSGPFVLGNLTPIGTQTDSVPDQALTIFTSLVNGTVPAGDVLVVEVFTPDGRDPIFNSFYIGSNSDGQTDPSYLRADDCGIAQPTDTGAIGFPNMHIVLNVIGNEALVPDLTLDKTVGTDPSTCAATDSINVPAGYGGTDVYYCYYMTNTGTVTFTLHTVVDDQLGTLLGPDFPAVVGPGASAWFTVTTNITQTTVNSATWSASDQAGAGASASDTATVTQDTPTGVALTGFDAANGKSLAPLYFGLLLALVAGFGLVLRRKMSV